MEGNDNGRTTEKARKVGRLYTYSTCDEYKEVKYEQIRDTG